MTTTETLYWYDLETFGIHSQYDRIAQFAGLRTDLQLQPIGDPLLLYCKIPIDYIPDPLACLVTGITPQETLEKGVNEYSFISKILNEFMVPGTCTVGYNSIRFDDEFIRNALYRNFYDPYKREYVQGNSRWDIIDLVRAAHDLRPEGITWPRKEDGKPSFRLEHLSAANDISHEHAHDALADVYATIEVAKLIKTAQPDLFSYAYQHRKKTALKELIDLHNFKPVVYTSSIFTSEKGCTTIIAPIAVDPHNANMLICFDLRVDPESLLKASPEVIYKEPGITKVALNKSPFLAPVSAMTKELAQSLGIDAELCFQHRKRLLERPDISMKVRKAFDTTMPDPVADPDFRLYTGGFFSDADVERFSVIHRSQPQELLKLDLRFDDKRAPEMLWRFVCRNFPEVLHKEEAVRWKNFVATRILFPPGDIMIDYHFFRRKIIEKGSSPDISPKEKLILKELSYYADEIEKTILE